MIDVLIEARTVSEANSRAHWGVRARRSKKLRSLARLLCAGPVCACRDRLGGTFTVRLIRVAPHSLDTDNLAAALKAIRDGVTDALAPCGVLTDADPRVTWEYAQERGEPKQYAVRVEVRP